MEQNYSLLYSGFNPVCQKKKKEEMTVLNSLGCGNGYWERAGRLPSLSRVVITVIAAAHRCEAFYLLLNEQQPIKKSSVQKKKQ